MQKNKKKPPINYVLPLRKRWALTQKELAHLSGSEDRSTVSRIERGERLPTMEFALALEVLFGDAPRSVFPHYYADIEDEVLAKASVLHEGFVHSTKPSEIRKSKLFERALSRAIQSDNHTQRV